MPRHPAIVEGLGVVRPQCQRGVDIGEGGGVLPERVPGHGAVVVRLRELGVDGEGSVVVGNGGGIIAQPMSAHAALYQYLGLGRVRTVGPP